MIEFNMKIDPQKVSEPDRKALQELGVNRIFESILNGCLNSTHKDGLSGPRLRSLARIYNKLDLAESGSMDLENAELDLLKEVFLSESTKVLPGMVRIFVQYQEEIERCSKLAK